ncbi:hypothetical protein POSPLADRAFT_1046024 [Postia placenta MAD-698-R-SB12]|uniref:UBC core domain-containing protein n=1 Tax=Postia placenta MAD-698-R-SB12 TaxID=670580 RepID=A0A1X6N1R1_9APHY|nr:hypothetical protein POSPLADRAFT_1046024 [Postia placenta MAD-698-R-SB12]OSX62557.1 hypothetical protein POSPLADRAFT_1046024 [Postia placenta MAD-698-R-SB12]
MVAQDASEYPGDHAFFCYIRGSRDVATSMLISPIAKDVTERGSQTIEKMLRQTLASVSRKLAVNTLSEDEQSDEEIDASAEEDFDEYDDHFDDDFGLAATSQKSLDHAVLQSDFIEIVAYGYRPGFVPIGIDEHVMSVSHPIIRLADDIPAHVLMAWDRRLLAQSQHLTLLVHGLRGVYPVLRGDGSLSPEAIARGSTPQFKVGMTPRYKPRKEDAVEATRVFGLRENQEPQKEKDLWASVDEDPDEKLDETDNAAEAARSTEFEHFSLSTSLETLLNDVFLPVLKLRLKYDLGWAGAEALLWEAERKQQKSEDIAKSMRLAIHEAEERDRELSLTYKLPPDPLLSRDSRDRLNLPLLAFSYLLRRLTLCPRYCIVCHDRLLTDYEALKPYVCDSPLCTYRYYHYNRGPSLEYEIRTNPETVDLLASLAYSAASAKVLDDPLPVGMGLRVPSPDVTSPAELDGLCEFDRLTRQQMCTSIAMLLDELPPIATLKKHLEKPIPVGKMRAGLKDFDRSIPEAAWFILRWCVASCTAHIEEMKNDEERLQNINPEWRQFRFSVGAPDAEAKFHKALESAQVDNHNARRYPCLYAFHGSHVHNWHSIIRHGLWYKTIANGRAYGNGVYFAKEGNTSLSGYAHASGVRWKSSEIGVSQCMALAQIVNLPSKFVSNDPFFVVADTEWILCRYLLVRGLSVDGAEKTSRLSALDIPRIPLVPLDPAHPVTLSSQQVMIPDPTFIVDKLLSERHGEFVDVDYDEEDSSILEGRPLGETSQANESIPSPVVADWIHDPIWLHECVEHLLPPPREATPQATMALQRELKAMLREQDKTKSMRELGWYMPPDFIGDNLFQWIVELHSFDEDLPIAQDMKAKGINSLAFEIRFPPSFPLSPPFFRILKPRFLPFIQGGGGHITGGGSMCMDLLTADGWLPSYSISAILLQIKLAISNLDPRPARLAQNWDAPYRMNEALEGYKRAASTHGWTLPAGLDRLVR